MNKVIPDENPPATPPFRDCRPWPKPSQRAASAELKPRPTPRKRPTRWLKQKILSAQDFRCLGCSAPIGEHAIELDHVIPLALGGLNHLDNWAALCLACHRTKTTADLRQIAKAHRQRRFQELGKGRLKRTPADESALMLRRHMDGVVTPKIHHQD